LTQKVGDRQLRGSIAIETKEVGASNTFPLKLNNPRAQQSIMFRGAPGTATVPRHVEVKEVDLEARIFDLERSNQFESLRFESLP
jgi:hypothetical protein